MPVLGCPERLRLQGLAALYVQPFMGLQAPAETAP